VPKDQAATAETLAVKLSHFASALSVPNLGPGLIKKLVEFGYTTPRMLMELSTEKWCEAIGKGNGVKIQKAFIDRVRSANEMELMIASSLMPRGVGETKLTILFQKEADWKKWSLTTLTGLQGWSNESLSDFLTLLPRYEAWRKEQFPITVVPIGVVAPLPKTNTNLFIVVTGFRSSEFEAACLQKGIVVLPSLTKQAQVLVTAGSDSSTKAKKAGDMGIRILERSAFEKEYLSSA
jgi:NAD-dependent DNA ligase